MPTEKWGNITWAFFHTLVQKVDENKFDKMLPIVLNIITDTCTHLPCPTCASDGSDILKQGYTKNIKTKAHLVEFIRQFHNIVNVKLGQKTYTRQEVQDLKYEDKNINILFNEMVRIFSTKYGLMKMMSYNMHKEQFLKRLKVNISKFQQIRRE